MKLRCLAVSAAGARRRAGRARLWRRRRRRADVQLRVGPGRHRRHRPEPVGRRARHARPRQHAAVQQPEAVVRRGDRRASVRSRARVAGAGAADRAAPPDRHQLPERLPRQPLRRDAARGDGQPAHRDGDGAGGARLREVHTVVGESGQPMTVIKKNPTNLPTTGTSGRAYDATLFEAAAITRLAGAMGKSYGIGAIVVTHGESDAGNTNYADDLYQLLTDYNTDLARADRSRRRRSRCWSRSRTRCRRRTGWSRYRRCRS